MQKTLNRVRVRIGVRVRVGVNLPCARDAPRPAELRQRRHVARLAEAQRHVPEALAAVDRRLRASGLGDADGLRALLVVAALVDVEVGKREAAAPRVRVRVRVKIRVGVRVRSSQGRP